MGNRQVPVTTTVEFNLRTLGMRKRIGEGHKDVANELPGEAILCIKSPQTI